MASNAQTLSQLSTDMISEQQQSVKTTKTKTIKTRVSKKMMITNQSSVTSATTMSTANNNTTEVVENSIGCLDVKQQTKSLSHMQDVYLKNDISAPAAPTTPNTPTTPTTPSDDEIAKLKNGNNKKSVANNYSNLVVNGKKRSKKIKKSEAEKENISVQFEEGMRIFPQKNNWNGEVGVEGSTPLETSSDSNDTSTSSTNMSSYSNDCTNSIELDECFTSIKDNPFMTKALAGQDMDTKKPLPNTFNFNTCLKINEPEVSDQGSQSTTMSLLIEDQPASVDSLLESRSTMIEDVLANIDVKRIKSSFSKFDALQKRNLIHDAYADKIQNCRVCNKQVYKMEEIKAEKSIYHKNCFRCNECEKQLKVDTYQSHEGVLYCKAHFKQLFSPKVVEDTPQDKPRKPELIIRENQPVELPPDVVRASDKPDLGLEELQQIDIRSKFEAFEKCQVETNDRTLERTQSQSGVKRSASILSKLAKFQAKGLNTGVNADDLDNIPCEQSSESEQDSSDNDDETDSDLVRAKRAQRERPIGIGNMNDIKTKFESGHIMSKEERREERKQEIQNIRSRLFMGKQARIKEMYQQAVAESEHAITSVGKKSDIDIGDKARSLKEKFEKGEIFKEHDEPAKVPDEELDVFQSGISKKSRSLFQELDATAVKTQQQSQPLWNRQQSQDQRNRLHDDHFESQVHSPTLPANVVKHDEKLEDVHIETSDISSKFKFFETYKPTESEKKTFRITPPREGVVKLPTPDRESETEQPKQPMDTEPAEKTQTATIMLSKFREMEQTKNRVDSGPRPLKCFTPPPDENHRLYSQYDSDMENMSEDDDYEDEEKDDEDYNGIHIDARSADQIDDQALKEAQAAARAKQLRAKFEKWEANEIQREIQDGTISLCEENADQNQVESAKTIRAKFENMRDSHVPTRNHYKVNRFV